MNPLPPLTEEERGRLRTSIQQDGVIVPVLLDARGDVIDGHHRKEIAAELGVACPTQTLDVDDETADRLRLTLNWARRQLDTLTAYELIAELARRHDADAKAEARARMAEGGKGGLQGVQAACTPSGKGKVRDVIASRINDDLKSLGVDKRVSGQTVDTARAAAALPAETKTRIRNGELSTSRAVNRQGRAHMPRNKGVKRTGTLRDRPGRDQDLGELARIRSIDAECQFQSMLNAPPQKLNLPLIRRAEKIMEMLTELIALDPAVAAGQLPIERCREFTVAHAAWWSEFSRICEERRAVETPDLPPRPFRPVNAVLNSVVLGGAELPTEERALTPGERAVLDWVRAQDEPVTATQVAVGLRNRSRQTIMLRIRKLAVSNLIEPAGKAGKETAYQAVDPA